MLPSMFLMVWSLRTLFETAWRIAPTSFLRLTFGIANNDNTENDGAKEEGGWVDGPRSSTTNHDNQQKATWVRRIFWLFLHNRKTTCVTNEMAIRT
jgi:hypothetical protein